MSRSILLPLLALGGLILFGTTRAARPGPEPPPAPVVVEGPTRTPISERADPRPAAMPEPPPAPRLRSEVEAAPEAPPADSTAAEAPDSTAAEPAP